MRAEWTEVGSGAKSKIVIGGVGSDGLYDSGVLVGPTQIVALIGGTPTKPLTIRAARFRMKIAADGLTANEGSLSGVVPTEELVAEFKRYAATLDITQDPTKECDGISIGLGFELTRVVIGTAAAPVAPPANPCP